ncbi:uncharacterized protein LOC111266098 isoform X2 [Varroa jacobsoni]|uniref:Uncharacterized protein n=1 Tax=Varroa destructor TaxID=109461 RepID=A0A7M7KB15_VARDE|nr:uncharacterized protein LOC111251143 isoform X2 [Varroa destructor]XP_022699018.1 uncharacterized protein LOC111266098 isoform X2 [Varroa jacobsoni]
MDSQEYSGVSGSFESYASGNSKSRPAIIESSNGTKMIHNGFKKTWRLINPMEVTVLGLIRRNVNTVHDMVVVTCAEIDDDGVLHLANFLGEEIPKNQLRESLKPLAVQQVNEGQLVCIRGERGVLACVVTSISSPRGNRHQDRYELQVLNRGCDGQIVAGTVTMKRREVYEMPGLFLVRPLNPIETVPAPLEAARFVHDMTVLTLAQTYFFTILFQGGEKLTNHPGQAASTSGKSPNGRPEIKVSHQLLLVDTPMFGFLIPLSGLTPDRVAKCNRYLN